MPDNLLTAQPYPFHLAIARELHLTLCQLYPTSKAAMFVAQKAQLTIYQINTDQASYLVWADILQLAASTGRLRELVTTAANDFPSGPARPLFDALLQNQVSVLPSEPRAADGAPHFRRGTDDITEPEALLFHDDLTLPAGRLPWLIDVLGEINKFAPAVCRLEVICARGEGSGTAFRIASDLLLTNHHVLYPDGDNPTGVTATFGYEDDGKGKPLPGTPIDCDVASIKADNSDDWGIIRVNKSLPKKIPIVSLRNAAKPVKDGCAFIVQHPRGARKRVGYVRNRITYIDNDVIQYLTDTEIGSSGSPVFDEAGKLIALHHAGGRPQEVAGRNPLKKNEGIRIERVIAGIKAVGVNLT